MLEIGAPAELARFIAAKGSIAIDGVSLTVNAVDGARFSVNLIPHTLAVTTLGALRPARAVNLEVDLIARYIERLHELSNVRRNERAISTPLPHGGATMDLTTLERLPLWIGGRAVRRATTRYGEVTNPGDRRSGAPRAARQRGRRRRRGAGGRGGVSGWRAAPPLRRARILMRFRELMETHKNDLARLVTAGARQDAGRRRGLGQRGIEVVEFAMGIPHLLKGEYSENVGTDVDSYSLRQPLGVCAGITPFNFPAMVPMWMFPVAHRLRQHVHPEAVRARSDAALRMAELLKEAGLARRRVQRRAWRQGGGRCDPRASGHQGGFVRRLDADRADTSTRPARAHGKRVQALGGAKNHAVVMPDADLDFAAEALIGAGYGSAGERCMAVSAVVAVGDAGDALRRQARRARAQGDRRTGRRARTSKWGRWSPARRATASSG